MATTLASAESLCRTYDHGATNIAKLKELKVSVHHGVDATNLNKFLDVKPNVVIFNYPHLGNDDKSDEDKHKRRHRVLVAHYLNAAKQILARDGSICVTLSGNQHRDWSLKASAHRMGLRLVAGIPTNQPGLPGVEIEPWPPQKHWSAGRKFRSVEQNRTKSRKCISYLI